jgi:tetratricopeptide (TPR) repeat protein
LGLVHLAFGEYEPALECFERALEIMLAIGNRPDILLLSRGLAHHGLAHYERAQEFYEQEIESARESGQFPPLAQALRALGEVLLDLPKPHADAERALSCIEEALELARRMENPLLVLGSLATAARAYLTLGRPTEALEYSKEAVRLLAEGRPYPAPQEPYFFHALALQAYGDRGRGHRFAKRAWRELHKQAKEIADASRRARFLRKPLHRKIERAAKA